MKIKVVACIATLSVALRLFLLLAYGPVAYSDTPSYRRLAETVLNGFQRYDGTRTPGYPIFLALVGDDQQVYLAQLLLGLLTTLLILWIGWRLTGNAWLSAGAALAHTLNLGQLFFEASLLTETLCTFWQVLALAGTLLLMTSHPKRPYWLAAGVGLAAALAAITRPLFIYLPFWLMLTLMWHTGQSAVRGASPESPLRQTASRWLKPLFTWRSWANGLAVGIPALIIIASWVYFIHDRYHMWGLSTMTGYHMVQHTGNFFEYLPDEEAVLRDTYLKYRQAHVAAYGTQTNTIWEAIPEMQAASGLTFYDLSRRLSQLSSWLIWHHPGLYLRNVLKGWWMFWRAPVYWQPEAFDWQVLAKITGPLVLLERGVLVAVNLAFVAFSLPSLFLKQIMPEDRPRQLFLTTLVGTIWIGSIVQSLADHGDNPRFLVPMQSLVVLWVIWFAYRATMAYRIKHAKN